MANIPITSLPLALAVLATDQLAIVQAGTTKRATVEQLGDFIVTVVPPTIVSAAGNYEQEFTDQFIYLTGAHTRNVELLPADITMIGRLLWIKVDANGPTNPQTIIPNGTDTIEGLTSLSLNGAYQWVLLYCVEIGLWLLMT